MTIPDLFSKNKIFYWRSTAVAMIYLLLVPLLSIAQKDPDIPDTRKVTVMNNQNVISAEVFVNDKNIKPTNQVEYYWYYRNTIQHSQGGYQGKLLCGDYCEYNPDNSLKEKGTFKNGIKHGEWKTWYANGKLKAITWWKKGKKHGTAEDYSDTGELEAFSVYKNGELKKKTVKGKNGIGDVTIKYRDGKKVERKQRSFFRKLKKLIKRQDKEQEKQEEKPKHLKEKKGNIFTRIFDLFRKKEKEDTSTGTDETANE